MGSIAGLAERAAGPFRGSAECPARQQHTSPLSAARPLSLMNFSGGCIGSNFCTCDDSSAQRRAVSFARASVVVGWECACAVHHLSLQRRALDLFDAYHARDPDKTSTPVTSALFCSDRVAELCAPPHFVRAMGPNKQLGLSFWRSSKCVVHPFRKALALPGSMYIQYGHTVI